ncbi:MAG: N-formylglutamate amidohydrolase [Candidatus Eisenbacteria bacterium]
MAPRSSRSETSWALLVTCEHGGNRVPPRYRALFREHGELLRSHRGFDAGALATARLIARTLSAPLVDATVTRLVVDLNRTERSATRFSEITRPLSDEERDRILRDHYQPHWNAVRRALSRLRERPRVTTVLHVASHSFTPVWKGRERRTDIGLLFDPQRASEARFARIWQRELRRLAPELAVHRNAPYRGWTDGMTSELRRGLPAARYLGFELEVNQRLLRDASRWRRQQRAVVRALAAAIEVASSR